MHGIRIDSDVEDTPDKRIRPQQNRGNARGPVDRDATKAGLQAEAPGSAKKLVAAQAVRRSRLRLASKGSAANAVSNSGDPATAQPLPAAQVPPGSALLPNFPTVDEHAATPQRPRPRPRRQSAKPKASKLSDGASGRDASVAFQAAQPGQYQSCPRPPSLLRSQERAPKAADIAVSTKTRQGIAQPVAQAAVAAAPEEILPSADLLHQHPHESEFAANLNATVRAENIQTAGGSSDGRTQPAQDAEQLGADPTGAAAGGIGNPHGANKRTVQAKLSFFAPQVPRRTAAARRPKSGAATAPNLPPLSPEASPPPAVNAAQNEDSGRCGPAPQGPQDKPLCPDIDRAEQLLAATALAQPGTAPGPVGGTSVGGDFVAADEALAPAGGPPCQVDLTDAADVPTAALPTTGTVAAPAGDASLATEAGAQLTVRVDEEQPQRRQPQHQHQQAAALPPALPHHATRARRQALLPGAPPPAAPPPTATGVSGEGTAAAAAGTPTGADPAVPHSGVVGSSPVKTRHRGGSRTGDAEGAVVVPARGRGRGRGRGSRGSGASGSGTAAAEPAPNTAPAVPVADVDSGVEEGDGEAEDEPTRRGQRGCGSAAPAGLGRGRGRSGRGSGRGRAGGEGCRAGRGRRGSGVAAAADANAASVPAPGEVGGSGIPESAGAPLRGKDGLNTTALQQAPQGLSKPALPSAAAPAGRVAPTAAGTVNRGMSADEAKENRPLVQDSAEVSEAGAATGRGTDGGGAAAAAGPAVGAAKAQGAVALAPPVSEMFLSVAERRRRQRQRQEEEAGAQRREAEERELREREQREREQRDAEERERERERQRAEAVESIDLSGSPKQQAAVPVNPFFRARKRPEPPPGGETGGAIKRPSTGGAHAGGGASTAAASARLLPALAPVHVRQADCAASADGLVPTVAAVGSSLLQLDADGALRLVPLNQGYARMSETATQAHVAERRAPVFRFSFRRPAPFLSLSPTPGQHKDRSSAQAGGRAGGAGTAPAATKVAVAAGCRVGSATGTTDRLLEELATYLQEETQLREGGSGAADGEAELLDLPTREEILRQLTNELYMRRRRVAMQPSVQTGARLAGGDGQEGNAPTGASAAAAAAAGPAAGPGPGEQLWCTAQQPFCASELCGNAVQVARLKAWLSQWREIIMQEGKRREEGVAGPRQRHGRRRSDDSYFTEGDDSDWDARSAGGTADSGDERDGGGAQHKGLATAMLLRGPPGCGKTAAAYAVASELGFRVLEVNPSADRSGPQLLKLVGEATKSRRLVQGLAAGAGAGTGGVLPGGKNTAAAAPPAGAATRGGRRGREAARGRQGGGGAGRKVSRRTLSSDEDSAAAASSPSPSPVKRRRSGRGGGGVGAGGVAAAAARLFGGKDAVAAPAATTGGERDTAWSAANGRGSMTLMLFDEVDVLPDEDRGFMGALISIIQQSKRPIILTCGRGQLPAALRGLGLQELEFQPAQEAQLLRAVVMACAAACTPALTVSEAPSQPRPFAPPCASGEKASGHDAVMQDPEVLDLSAAATDDSDAEGEGLAAGRSRSAGGVPRQGSTPAPVLPSLLLLVRSCRGDLRHAMLQAQFWLGAGGAGSSWRRGVGRAGGAPPPLQLAGALCDEDDDVQGLVPGSCYGDGDIGGVPYGIGVDAAWRAVAAAAAMVGAAAARGADSATSSTTEATYGTQKDAAGRCDGQTDRLAAVLPNLRLWLASSNTCSTASPEAGEQQEVEQQDLQQPTHQRDLTAPCGPAARRLQWQSFEDDCRRVREQQLTARWLELAVARAMAKQLGKRPRGSMAAGVGDAGEEAFRGPVEDEDEVSEVEGSRAEGGGGGGGVIADKSAEGMSSEDGAAVAALEPKPSDQEMTNMEEVCEQAREWQQKADEQGLGKQQAAAGQDAEQQDAAGGGAQRAVGAVAADAAPSAATSPSGQELQPQQPQAPKPQKRRAPEAEVPEAETSGSETGMAAVQGAAAGDGGGRKRSRLSRAGRVATLVARAGPPGHEEAPMAEAALPAAVITVAPRQAEAEDCAEVADPAPAPAVEPPAEGPYPLIAATDLSAPMAGPVGDPPAGTAGLACPPLAPSSLNWVLPAAPRSLRPKPEVLTALAATAGATSLPEVPEVLGAAVNACRVQAALADLYDMVSVLDVLAAPHDAYAPVSGACPRIHHAAYSCVRPLQLGSNVALRPPQRFESYRGHSTTWVLADAVRDQEDVPGRLLGVLAAEAEAAGLGAGEPAGPTGHWCAAEAAASAARLAATAAAAATQMQPDLRFRPNPPPADAAANAGATATAAVQEAREQLDLPAAAICQRPPQSPTWQLVMLHSTLSVSSPGFCASGTLAAMDRLSALASICASEAARRQREARRARGMRRPPTFCHYLASLDLQHMAALHQLNAFGVRPAAAEAAVGEEDQQGAGLGEAAVYGRGGRLLRRFC